MGADATMAREEIMRIDDVRMEFPLRRRGIFARAHGAVHALNDVSLTIHEGEVLGLVGESGCGKSTLGRCLVGTHRATSGHVYYRDREGRTLDVTTATGGDLRRVRRDVRVIFQDPFSSLNPRMTILQIVGDPLVANGIARGSEVENRVAEMLRKVGLTAMHMHRYPHAFSGGERQRVNIARALIMNPRIVIADEAVSALDVSVRAQILNLLRDLQDELNLTYLFISHDLSVIESLCDRVAVMYLGRIVELAKTEDLYSRPRHPYTEALISAVPRADPRLRGTGQRIALPDTFPDPADPPSGCHFHTRCQYRQDDCVTRAPALEAAGRSFAACHYHDSLQLTGVEVVRSDPDLATTGSEPPARTTGSGSTTEMRIR